MFDPDTQRSVSRLNQVAIPPLYDGMGAEESDPRTSLLDFFPHPPLLLLDEPDSLKRTWAELEERE